VTDTFADYVVGHGELWCAQLFAATVRRLGAECEFMDTREARLPLRFCRPSAVVLI
jgi:aspartokinase/homoserine dehydrogenase 1